MSNFVFIPGKWETFRINGKLRRYYRPYHGSDDGPRPRYGTVKVQTCYDTKACDWPCYQNPDFIEAHQKEEEENRKTNRWGNRPNRIRERTRKKRGISKLLAASVAMLLFCSCSQKPWHRPAAATACAFASGAAWGLHETINHHPAAFLAKFPSANQRFWIPAKSWDRPTFLGYKFDAKHLLASGAQVGAFGCGVFVAIGEKRPVWRYATDIGISFAAYSAGNFATYNLFFRKK